MARPQEPATASMFTNAQNMTITGGEFSAAGTIHRNTNNHYAGSTVNNVGNTETMNTGANYGTFNQNVGSSSNQYLPQPPMNTFPSQGAMPPPPEMPFPPQGEGPFPEQLNPNNPFTNQRNPHNPFNPSLRVNPHTPETQHFAHHPNGADDIGNRNDKDTTNKSTSIASILCFPIRMFLLFLLKYLP